MDPEWRNIRFARGVDIITKKATVVEDVGMPFELVIICPECLIGEMIWSQFRFSDDPSKLHEGWYCDECHYCVSMWEVDE